MEFIGLSTEIVSPGYPVIYGKIIDETKNTFTIESNGVKKIIPKLGNIFRFVCEGEVVNIIGSKILHRPEDRIKKVR